ncbi:MAG: hypothetical protein INR73_17955 [Williamsia sp.]|nr:hypothetical protein [Williamsia sp.]
MKKNLYYVSLYGRDNFFKKIFYRLFLGLSSYPRLLLEVFIRKNFGERYFNLGSVFGTAVVFALLPRFVFSIANFSNYRVRTGDFWKDYALWYLFLLAFLVVSCKRWAENRRNPSVFDFQRFSMHSGEINRLFYRLPFLDKKPDVRTVETVLEPTLFLFAGILLCLFGQWAGFFLIICSAFYSFSYMAMYDEGDAFVMDLIDQLILNQQMEKNFVEDDGDPDDRHNDFHYIKRPRSKEHRAQLLSAILQDEKDADETVAR